MFRIELYFVIFCLNLESSQLNFQHVMFYCFF